MIHSYRVTSVTFRDIYKTASLVIVTDLFGEAVKMRRTVNGNTIMVIGKNKAVFSTPKENVLHVLAFG